MPQRKKQSFLHGALILMAATVLVKLIGALFKIPLGNLIGGEGMGYFTTAYGLFNPIYALSIAGLPVAVSKMVAEYAACKRYRDIRKTLRVSCVFFLVTGTAGFLLMVLGARPFVRLVANEGAFLSVLAITPAIFFGCAMSAYRGYYEGLRNMYPTGVSQVIEAVVKLGLGLLLSGLLLRAGQAQYAANGTVFGVAASSEEQAVSLSLQAAAAGAILGITASTLAGAVYLFLRHRLRGDGVTKAELSLSPPAHNTEYIFKNLVRIAVPVCLGSVVTNLTSIIDLSSVMNRLVVALERNSGAVLSMYAGLLPDAVTLERVPNYLYGSQGFAVNIFNLVPSITTALGISALPAVTAAWAGKNHGEIKRTIESVLRITALFAIPAGIGLSTLSGPVLNLLYASRPQEAAIAAPILRIMGIAAVFVSVASPCYSMLQAVGRADLPVKFMLIGGGVKLAVNYVLVAIPEINIKGAPVGSVFCYGFILFMSIRSLCRITHVELSYSGVFIKPLAAALLCGVSAFVCHALLSRVTGASIATLAAVAVAGAVYIVALFCIRAVQRDDILMLPGGEKICKALEKRGLIR